jgi:hypothetical protein
VKSLFCVLTPQRWQKCDIIHTISIYRYRDNLDILLGFLLMYPRVLDFMNNIQSLHSSSKDRVFAIKPGLHEQSAMGRGRPTKVTIDLPSSLS